MGFGTVNLGYPIKTKPFYDAIDAHNVSTDAHKDIREAMMTVSVQATYNEKEE